MNIKTLTTRNILLPSPPQVLPGYVATSLSLNAVTGTGAAHAQMDAATAKVGDEKRSVVYWHAGISTEEAGVGEI